jgi:hypothetical protein
MPPSVYAANISSAGKSVALVGYLVLFLITGRTRYPAVGKAE